jgi:hypothetical protein
MLGMGKCWTISTVIDYLTLKFSKNSWMFFIHSRGYRCIFPLISCLKLSSPLSALRSPLSARILTFPVPTRASRHPSLRRLVEGACGTRSTFTRTSGRRHQTIRMSARALRDITPSDVLIWNALACSKF